MQQDAAASCGHHHGHLAALWLHGVEEEGGAADGLGHYVLYALVGNELGTHLHHTGGHSHLRLSALFHDDVYDEGGSWPLVGICLALAVGKLYALYALGEGRLYADDARVALPCLLVEAEQQLAHLMAGHGRDLCQRRV